MTHKMYLKKVNEGGIIHFRVKNAKKITIKVLDKFKQNISTVYFYHTKDAIIISENYVGCDACIFCEY